MKRKIDFLPRRLEKEDIALAPTYWGRLLSKYRYYRNRAIKESEPGYATFIAILMTAIAKHDRYLIDTAIEITKDNVPRETHLAIAGSALCDFGEKEKGLSMLREATRLKPSHANILAMVANTDDSEEAEDLVNKVLNEDPQNTEALRLLAYAKYYGGEPEEAEKIFDEILLKEPDNNFAVEFKGNIYFDKEEYDNALSQYLKIKLKPRPISLQLKISHCYYLLGNLKKAKKIAKKIQGKISKIYKTDEYLENSDEILSEILNS